MRCELCPRMCGALRDDTHGEGICHAPELPRIARAALHFWEEPPISGTKGSGTIFFTGCPLGCIFCQNEGVSHGNVGQTVTVQRVKEIGWELIRQGANNLNFVTPTHYAHIVEEVLEEPFGVPAVWNSGGYDRVETLRRLEGKIDVYLPDLKYVTPERAKRYSGAEDYPEVALDALEEMVRQVGKPVFEDGLLKKGVIVRHLLLPGGVNEAKLVLDAVKERFPNGEVLVSLMSQYVPFGRAKDDKMIGRKLRKGEIRAAQEYLENLGLEGFCQGEEAADREYIPAFDLTGVEKK